MKELECLRDIGTRGPGVFDQVFGYRSSPVLPLDTLIMCTPLFCSNCYCCYRYDLFYHFPVAHMLLYGICKDFWKLVLRKKSDVLPYGQDVWLDKPARDQMRRLFNSLRVTSSFSASPKDVTKCGQCSSTISAPFCVHHPTPLRTPYNRVFHAGMFSR